MEDSTTKSPNSGRGGYKQPGVLNENSQRQKDVTIRGILANWKITDLNQAFPPSIKPVSLGNSALLKIKAVSGKKSLAEAQALYLQECKAPDGKPVALGFAHASRVWENVKDSDTADPDDDEENRRAESSTTLKAASTPSKKSRKDALDGSTANFSAPKFASETQKQTVTKAPKALTSISAANSNTLNHFTIGGTPTLQALRNGDENKPTKSMPHTKGVAILKKQSEDSNGKAKTNPYKKAFGFLGDGSSDGESPSLAKRKNKRPAKNTGERELNGEKPVTKKTKMDIPVSDVDKVSKPDEPALWALLEENPASLIDEMSSVTPATVAELENDHPDSDDEDTFSKMLAAVVQCTRENAEFFKSSLSRPSNHPDMNYNEDDNPLKGLFTPSSSPAPGSAAHLAPTITPCSLVPCEGDSDSIVVDVAGRERAAVFYSAGPGAKDLKQRDIAGSDTSAVAAPVLKESKENSTVGSEPGSINERMSKEKNEVKRIRDNAPTRTPAEHPTKSKEKLNQMQADRQNASTGPAPVANMDSISKKGKRDMDRTLIKGPAEQGPKSKRKRDEMQRTPKKASPEPVPVANMYSTFSRKMDETSLQADNPLSHFPGTSKLAANARLPLPASAINGVSITKDNTLPTLSSAPVNDVFTTKNNDIGESSQHTNGATSNGHGGLTVYPYGRPVQLADIKGNMKKLMDDNVARLRENGQNRLAEGLETVFDMTMTGMEREFEKHHDRRS